MQNRNPMQSCFILFREQCSLVENCGLFGRQKKRVGKLYLRVIEKKDFNLKVS